MYEDKKIQAFFSLLRAGLWNRPVDREDCFPLSGDNWIQIYQYGIRQTIEGILFDGIQQLPPQYQPPRDILIKWLVRTEKIKQRNTWMNGIIKEQLHFFGAHRLSPLLLKGQGVAQCYLNPYRRLCGDIDWYFEEPADFRRANELLQGHGIKVRSNPGYTSSYYWNNAEVDQHQRLFDIHNPFLKKYLRNLEVTQKPFLSVLTLTPHSAASIPSPLLQIVQVSVHILKHLLSFGVGLRQLCDVANLYTYYAGQFDSTALKQIYHKLKISKWIDLLHQLLVDFLGVPEKILPLHLNRSINAGWMMDEIWGGGNFGFHDKAHIQTKEGIYTGRKSTKQKIWRNVWRYLPYAPMEALSFPVMHYYSGRARS
ncbi:nucleotidyltransferase family protein [Olivibacter sp. CPCC 100613]|uniref:nucleotidyltransferase domain-containing protein n=1 Tax=Olivibacter sp. CPCC 100613 TaxID=3079931 RepID=UPI002FFCB3DE